MNMLLIAVPLVATISFASGIECPNVAKPMFDATSRAAVLAKHNEYRAMLTHGTARYKGGHNLKSGKNIYELVWDCDLEKHAQDWSNNCEFKHSHTPGMGENLFESSPLSVEQGGVQAVESWWSELQKYDASVNPNMDFNDGVFSVAGHWSQLAWGATTKVGCGLANCGSGGSASIKVTCNYVIPGNMQGAVIFQLGDGCSSDSECTTYPESKCNVTSKLCMQKQAQTTPAQPGPQTTQTTPAQPGAQTTQATPGKPGPQTTQPAKPGVTPAPGGCEDTATNCAMYASYCFIQPYSRTVQRRCKKTCNVCDCQDTDANCASQMNNCDSEDVRTKCQLKCGHCGGCSDDANNCALMSYLCNDATFGSVMKARCKKTCNFC